MQGGDNMSRKKTHEEYVAELAIKNPNLDVVEKYIDAKTKIMHRCKLHGIKWRILPSNALKGKGCVECCKEKKSNKLTKTHEEYVEQINNVNPAIQVIDRYVDSKTPILHLCTKHNVYHKVSPSNVLNGQGCPQCGKESYRNKRAKTHEEYVEEVRNVNPSIEVLDRYVDSYTPINHYCAIHSHIWLATPTNILLGKGCSKCGIEKLKAFHIKDHNTYVREISYVNPTIEVIDKYVGSKTKIKHHCLIHDVYWDIAPSNVLKGCGCPQCLRDKIANAHSFTTEKYKEMLTEKNPNIIVLEDYVNINTPISHKCTIHDVEWSTTPASVLQGCGCPQCKSEKISNALLKTHEEYVVEVNNVNPNIVVLEKYSGVFSPIKHKCLIDGHEWFAAPGNILYGYGCPKCNSSKGEKSICQWLDDNQIKYISQKKFDDCKDIRALPFDFYLPDYNLCIEYDGEQHFKPVNFGGISDEEASQNYKTTLRHDHIKNEFCQNNDISLLRISFYENPHEILNNFLFN